MFRNMKKSTVILILTADVLIGIGVVLLYYFKVINTAIFTILLFIALITFSTITSGLMGNHMQRKMVEKHQGEKYQMTSLPELKEPGTKSFDLNYGKVMLYLNNKEVYYLAIIEDVNLFFSEEQEALKYKIDDRKFTKACQFFIFHNPDNKLNRKLQIMNYQAEHFFVASFIYNDFDKTIFQTDKVLPNEEFQGMFDKMFTYLDIKEKVLK